MNNIELLKNNSNQLNNEQQVNIAYNDIVLWIFNDQQQTSAITLNANFQILLEAILKNSGFANAKYIEPIIKTYDSETGYLQTVSLDYNLNDFTIENGALSLIKGKAGKWFANEVDSIDNNYLYINNKQLTFSSAFITIINQLISNNTNFEERVKAIINNYLVSWDNPNQ